MKGAFTCPLCNTENACTCASCKPHIKEGEYVAEWDKFGEILTCGKCKKAFSLDESLDAEFKNINKETN